MDKLQMFFCKFHAVLEYGETVPLAPVIEPGPLRVLQVAYVPFGMRHKAEYPAGAVAYSRDIFHRSVGIIRIFRFPAEGIRVFKYYHTVFFKLR